jgi:hypothetical protein
VKAFFSLLILMSSVASLAAPATSVMSAEERAALAERWGGLLQSSYTQSLYDQKDGTKSESASFGAEVNYKLTRAYKLALHLEGSQDLQHQEDSDLDLAYLGLSRSEIKVANKLFLLAPSAKVRFPISKADRRSSFITAFDAGLKTALNPEYLFSKKLSMALTLAGRRYVHTYTEATNGDINTEYRFAQALDLGWDFTSFFGVSFNFTHINAWDYNGLQKEYYTHAEELDFTVNKNCWVALGHQYGNPFLSIWAPNQQDYNFNVMDERNSLIYAQVTYTF